MKSFVLSHSDSVVPVVSSRPSTAATSNVSSGLIVIIEVSASTLRSAFTSVSSENPLPNCVSAAEAPAISVATTVAAKIFLIIVFLIL